MNHEAEKLIENEPELRAELLQDEIPVYQCTDAGNAERLADMLKGNYLYLPEKSAWYKYDGKVWQEDAKNKIVQDVIKCFRMAQTEAMSIIDNDKRTKTLKWLLSSESQAKINAAISLLSSIPFMCASINQFDKDDMLLNVQNGVVDLQTGELREHKREDYFTKICNVEYNPNAKSELFKGFMYEIMEGDRDKVMYLKKLFGYFCTGKIIEEEFYQMKGSGGNGKTKLMETVKYCLGSYAITASPEIIMAKDMNSIPNDVARLQGARLVLMSEPDPGKRFSDNAIKSLTGGDTIIARFLHKEFFEFIMKAKLVMLTNHEIKAIGTDNGLWRRIVAIPFTYVVSDEKKDKHLQEKLVADAEAVLAWMVEGCLLWQKEGLKQPEALKQAKNEYRKGQDAIGLFLDECCEEDSRSKISATDLYNTYKRWCESCGEYELSQREFGKRLREKGFTNVKSGVYYWFGIKVLDLWTKLDLKQININKKNTYKDLPKTSPSLSDSPKKEIPWWEKVDKMIEGGNSDELKA
ncbi:phage/plasmid primase, P4 family [Lutispora sp.]|uniref:DNA primase family protein n=1 Tax=Lutispora sp. TaxID=2828727 RepID=UPI00356877FF